MGQHNKHRTVGLLSPTQEQDAVSNVHHSWLDKPPAIKSTSTATDLILATLSICHNAQLECVRFALLM